MEDIKNDEIDLFDLIKVVFRWKLFISGFIIIGIIIISAVYFYSPVIYKSSASIKLGKIADLPLEKYEDLNLHLQISSEGSGDYYLPAGENVSRYFKDAAIADIVYLTAEKSKKPESPGVTLTATGPSYDETVSSLKSFRLKVIKRHDEIFKESIKKFENLELDSGNNYKSNYSYLITSYNYPTEALGKITTVQKKMGVEFIVNHSKKTAPAFHSGLIKYLILVFIGLTFFGMFSAFILDYILSEVKKRKVS